MVVRFAFILTVMLILLFGANFFIFWTLWKIMGNTNVAGPLITTACVIVGTSLLVILFRFGPDILWTIQAYFLGLWMGLTLQMIVLSAVFHIIDSIIGIPYYVGLIIVIGIGVLLVIYGFINASCIKVERVEIKIPGITHATTIAHLSDLHLGAILQKSFVQKIVDIVTELSPDLVVITGDLVDGNMDITYDMMSPFDSLTMPIFYILGNHEGYAGIDYVLSVVNRTKIVTLRNEQKEFNGINFVGIDFGLGKNHLVEQLKETKIPQDKPNVLLYHVPNTKVDDLEKFNINLHLAGHTHGGQIFPLQPFAWLANAYFSGLHSSKTGKSFVYVSTGLGTAGPPIRILSRSMIGLIKLSSQ